MTREGEGRVTLALALVAAACIYSFSRVFSGRAWLIPALVAAWGAIALTRWLAHLRIALRREASGDLLDRLIAAAILGVVGTAFTVVVVFPSATSYGLPTGHALAVAFAAVRAARHQISAVTAPILPNAGFLAMAMAGAWVAGAISAALIGSPLRQRPEGTGMSSLSPALGALVPWIVLFTLAAGVGQGGGRLVVVGVFFAAVLLYLLAESWSSLEHLPKLNGVLRLGVLSLAGALILPNIVPGYRAGPIFPWARLGPQTETTVSPLVKIQPFLLNQPNVLLFHVQADTAAYWRLTSLNHFDGNTWSSQGTYNPASGVLTSPPAGVPAATVRQHYTMASLGGIWVPAAFDPARVSGVAASVDNSTGTLIVSGLRPNDSYTVVSDQPQPTGAELAAAGAGSPPSPLDLALPASTVAEIAPIARSIVGSDTGAYAEAVALQSYLRTFRYDDTVPADASSNYLLTFLTQTHAGYCEQFAGAMAVMLRTLGIPSRVAVGFLPGQPGATDGSLTSYTVTGKDAHAWPEAYFAGIGWIAFEPTPRTNPPAYTLPPASAPTGQSPATPQAPQASAAAPAPSPQAAPRPSAAAPAPARQPAPHVVSTARQASNDLVVALVALLLLLVAGRELRLRLPGWVARSPQEKAMAFYEEFTLRAADAAGPREPGQTAAEYAQSVVQRLSIPPAAPNAVTVAYEQASYGRRAPDEATLRQARDANRALRVLLWQRADWRGRLRLTLSLRPLLTWRSRGSRRSRKGRTYELRPPRSKSAPSAARRV